MNRMVWMAVAIVVLGLAALGFANRKASQLTAKPALAAASAPAPAGKASAKSPAAGNGKPAAAPAPAGSAPRGIGYGLTFAMVNDPKLATETSYLSCYGEPKQMDRPHKEACNPYEGDTSCRTVLPVLCTKTTGQAAPTNSEPGLYQAWMNGGLGATQPVMGAVLDSAAAGHALCEKELGPGWRMAEFVDTPNGWGLQGQRGLGLGGNNRYWVFAKGQPANCWNSAP